MNYETWRVNLEMLDGMTIEDFGYRIYNTDADSIADVVGDLRMSLEEYVWDIVGQDAKGFALDLVSNENVPGSRVVQHSGRDTRGSVAAGADAVDALHSHAVALGVCGRGTRGNQRG